jgi:Flp pilus assembly protein TadB
LVALVLAAAAWCVAQAVRRAPVSVAAGRRAMFGEVPTLAAGGRGPAVVAGLPVPSGWVQRRLGERLQLVGLTAADVASRVAVSAAVLGFSVLCGVVALTALGMLPASPVWLALPVLTAAMGAWVAWRGVLARIEQRTAELRRAANDFVQLVAVGLTTDQSVEEAIRFALQVGDSAAFRSLRAELGSAPQRGVPVWEAIDDFGRRAEVRELREFAAAVERQGLQGVSIASTVATLATAMRAKSLDELEREADRANANLSGPTVGFVVTTIVFLAYPLAQRISDAFGG